ncbi:Pyruvate formate-lyase 1-activating enzyme [compost metagenome]
MITECRTLQVSGIADESIVDGPGIRFVVFVQGCPHNCIGCHNPKTHNFNGGKVYDIDRFEAQLKSNPLLQGVTWSGGEPLTQVKELIPFSKLTKSLNMDIMVYTGYTFEYILSRIASNNDWKELFTYIDYVMDGKFILSQRFHNLAFRGSANQRFIDVKESFRKNKIVTID